MQILINIENDAVAKKVLWFLDNLSNQGLSIIKKNNLDKTETAGEITDEYIEKNWEKIAYSASGNLNKNDDEVLEEKYGKYLYDKHSI